MVKLMPAKILNFPRTDLTGQIFERLTITSFAGYKENAKFIRAPFWNVICVCGNIKQVNQNCLVNKKTRSCGCLLEEFRSGLLPKITRQRNILPESQGAKNCLYAAYKQRAKKFNRAFDFSVEEFVLITSSLCFYCNSPPFKVWNPKNKYNGSYVYNGIDRKNPKEGYTKENSVCCCSVCNYAKNDLSMEEFSSWLERLRKG